jgi:hypothetical protein
MLLAQLNGFMDRGFHHTLEYPDTVTLDKELPAHSLPLVSKTAMASYECETKAKFRPGKKSPAPAGLYRVQIRVLND